MERERVQEEGVRLLKCYLDLSHFLLGGRLASAPPSRGPSCLDLPVSPPAACFRGLRRSGKGGEGLGEKSGRSPLSQGVGRLLSTLDVADSVEMTGETEVQRNVGICPKFVRRGDGRSRIGI